MNRKDLCYEHLFLDDLTMNFIDNVPTIGEESITDWLIWKWREIDNKFNYVKLIPSPFTKKQEVLNGADLELWIITKKYAIPLLFQAKKAIPMYDGYLKKLNYKAKGATHKQYQLLESYAKLKGLNPYYLIYTIDKDSSIFMLDINSVKSLATLKKSSRVSRKKLLQNANEFYKLFCEKSYRKYLSSKLKITSIDDIPNEIKKLIEQKDKDYTIISKSEAYYDSIYGKTDKGLNFLRSEKSYKYDIPNLNQYFNEEMINTNKYIVKNLAIFDLRNIDSKDFLD